MNVLIVGGGIAGLSLAPRSDTAGNMSAIRAAGREVPSAASTESARTGMRSLPIAQTSPVPSPGSSTRGATVCSAAGNLAVHTSGGSTTWSLIEMSGASGASMRKPDCTCGTLPA